MVMALASETTVEKRLTGQGREQIKYQYIQTVLENIIEYHRMFSNLLVHVSACVHDQKVFSLFFLIFFFYFSKYAGKFHYVYC